jgi:hypothetical protein
MHWTAKYRPKPLYAALELHKNPCFFLKNNTSAKTDEPMQSDIKNALLKLR